MELTAAAQGLNEFFFGYDSALLGALHSVAEGVGVVMTPMMKLITLLGEKGLIFFLLALVFICFARSRDLGVCIFGAVCCGALITNIILKDSIARPRPFETVEQFRDYPIPPDLSFLDGDYRECYPDYVAAIQRLDENVGKLVDNHDDGSKKKEIY